jgi:hypothetical protein
MGSKFINKYLNFPLPYIYAHTTLSPYYLFCHPSFILSLFVLFLKTCKHLSVCVGEGESVKKVLMEKNAKDNGKIFMTLDLSHVLPHT